MSKMVEVTVSMGATINLGNFESARVDISAKFQADASTENENSARKILFDESWAAVRDEVNARVKSIKEKRP